MSTNQTVANQEFRDAELNVIATTGSQHRGAALIAFVPPTGASNNPLNATSTPLSAVQITASGQPLAIMSNPA